MNINHIMSKLVRTISILSETAGTGQEYKSFVSNLSSGLTSWTFGNFGFGKSFGYELFGLVGLGLSYNQSQLAEINGIAVIVGIIVNVSNNLVFS